MAAVTLCLQRFSEDITPVTRPAFNLLVPATQWKPGFPLMFETGFTPSLWFMACSAVTAIAALVFIIPVMAVHAFCCRRHFMKYPGMARVAVDLVMPSIKRVFGIPVMIKVDVIPAPFRVAFPAFRAIAPRMGVIQSVAAETVGRRVFVLLVDMAGIAGHFCMFSTQWKICLAVFKVIVMPGIHVVAVAAGFAKQPLVQVFVPVAINAVVRCVAIFSAAGVTSVTLEQQMPAFQRVVRGVVIKDLHIELDNVRLTSLMVRMAVFAFHITCHTVSV